MTIFVSSAARFLIQAAQTVAAHDTVIMRQVPPVRTWFEQVVFVASGISTLLVLLLISGLVLMMFGIWRTIRRAHQALDRRVAEFGERVDDFNELIGKVHDKADAIVEIAGMAADGIKWGAQKMRDRHVAKNSEADEDDDASESPYREAPHASE
jgi:low affinity Fe/Cu permease